MAGLTLLVLAAGVGSRYGGLKQIEPVGPGGELIIDYSIFDACGAGFDRVVFVIRRQIEEQFRGRIGSRLEGHVALDYVFQEIDHGVAGLAVPAGRTRPWGTVHAVLSAAGLIQTPFAVINADDFYGRASYELVARHLRSGTADYAMAGYRLESTLSEFGPVARALAAVDEAGYLAQLVELKAVERRGDQAVSLAEEGGPRFLSGSETVSMNLWGFTPALFAPLASELRRFLELRGGDLQAECYLPAAIHELIHAGAAKVRVLDGPDAWFGVTHREDHPRAVERIRRLIEGGHYPGRLWE